MERIKLSERDLVIQLLERYYANHSLVHFSYLFQEENYFVIRDNGEIVAGCQVHPAAWIVKNIPGKLGGIFLKCIPFLPVVRTIFNPSNFKFLTFEGFYVKEGREVELIKLFESILSYFSLRACLIWLDVRDPLYLSLLKLGKHGIMKNFVDKASIKILAIPDKASIQTMQHIQVHPIYISTFDFI